MYPFIEAEKQDSHIQQPQRAQDGQISQDGEQKAHANVKRACELLKVSRSAYYAHTAVRAAGGSARQREDADLIGQIAQIHDDSNGTYGAPRVHAVLRAGGYRLGRKRVARLMRQGDMSGRTRRRWRKTTIADPAAPGRPDLINRDFGTDPGKVNTRWCGDITYIRTWAGWTYLATVIDIASRRVVGWAAAEHMRTDLVEEALRNAVADRRPEAGVIFHSDRGSQYTSAQFATVAMELGVRLSVGRKGECWDNAVGESFFATIKNELLECQAWPSHRECRTAMFEYIEGWYNTRRLHSSLGYLSPAAYENTRHATGTTDQAMDLVA
jgi:transposase InsO family protein